MNYSEILVIVRAWIQQLTDNPLFSAASAAVGAYFGSYLNIRAWRSQQKWTALEKCYNHLLTNLHHFKVALVDLSSYYIEPGSEHMPDQNQNAEFNPLLEQVKTSYCEVEKVRGASAMFLSDAAVKSLDKLFERHSDLAFGNSTAEYVFNSLELVKTAYDTILSEAKTQLAI